MYFKSNNISSLQSEVNNKGYVKNPNAERIQLESSKIELNREHEINAEKIKKLTDEINKLQSSSVTVTADDDLYKTLSKLIVENVDIEYELASIDKQLDFIAKKGDSSDFTNLLNTYYTKLDTFADTYVEIAKYQVNASSKVIYSTTSIQVDGGINLIYSMLISLAVGFIIAAITNVCLDHDYLYKPYPENTK